MSKMDTPKKYLIGHDYRCADCGAHGKKEQVEDEERIDSIGSLVAAIPTVEGDTFWGFTSVPDDRVKWWRSLPLRLQTTRN